MIFNRPPVTGWPHILATASLCACVIGCGGYTHIPLGGKVSGLTADGLVLANGDDTVVIPAHATTYVFPREIENQGPYDVRVLAQPTGLACALVTDASGRSLGTGYSTGIPITWIDVRCHANPGPST